MLLFKNWLSKFKTCFLSRQPSLQKKGMTCPTPGFFRTIFLGAGNPGPPLEFPFNWGPSNNFHLKDCCPPTVSIIQGCWEGALKVAADLELHAEGNPRRFQKVVGQICGVISSACFFLGGMVRNVYFWEPWVQKLLKKNQELFWSIWVEVQGNKNSHEQRQTSTFRGLLPQSSLNKWNDVGKGLWIYELNIVDGGICPSARDSFLKVGIFRGETLLISSLSQ